MDFNEFKNLVQETRTTRRFKKDIIIDAKEIEDVINVARLTSSAMNKQPLKYIVITKKELVKEIASTCKWASHLSDWTQSEDEQPSAFIIVLNDTSAEGFAMLDCGISLNCIMTALKIKGYASAPLASIDKDLIKRTFKLDKKYEPLIGIAIGIENETINIVKMEDDINYYRDKNDNHCVPKKSLEDVLLGTFR